MSRIYTTSTIIREYDKLESLICDLCQHTIRSPPNGDDWSLDKHSINRVVVSLEAGVWGESGSIRTTSFDICPTCFAHKLTPWLEAQGAVAITKEHSY